LEVDDTKPGRYFLSMPVANRLCDYDEIDEPTFEHYRRDLKAALPFFQRLPKPICTTTYAVETGR
jgi:hypothetical protein